MVEGPDGPGGPAFRTSDAFQRDRKEVSSASKVSQRVCASMWPDRWGGLSILSSRGRREANGPNENFMSNLGVCSGGRGTKM